MENKMITAQARDNLRGKWKIAVGVTVIYFAINIAVSSIPAIGWIASLIISGPLLVGLYKFFLNLSRGTPPVLETLFDGFSVFSTSLKSYLLMLLYVLLWSLLLIIPGIIAAISYSMIYFIIADNKNIGATDALKKSKLLMQGNKMRFFLLGCRFIGWAVLGILTAGIGFLWIGPYFISSMAVFYEDLVKNNG